MNFIDRPGFGKTLQIWHKAKTGRTAKKRWVLKIPIWEMPLAPPPPKTSATDVPVKNLANLPKSEYLLPSLQTKCFEGLLPPELVESES